MTLTQLITIVTLVENDFNVSMTAQKLYKVQSAISNQIRAIEEEFDALLFERKGKRLIGLTPLGKHLLPVIKDLINTKDNIKTIVDEYASEDSGELRIATTHTQARYFLPELIETFKLRYPNVRLTFHLDSPSRFPYMLRERHIDVAVFAEDHSRDPDLIEIGCYKWNRVLVVQREHPLARGDLTLANIAQYPIITYAKGYADRSLIDQAFTKAGLEIDVSCSAGDTDVIKTYVRLNMGVGIVAQMVKSDEETDLVFRDVSRLFNYSTTRVVYSKTCELRKYMKDFVQFLREYGRTFEKQLHT